MSKRKSGSKSAQMPSWEVQQGDCLERLAELNAASVDLAVCDPPYNQGEPYADYDDNKPAAEYMAWTTAWLQAIKRVLKPHGSLWVFAPDEWVSEIDVYCKRELKLYKRRHVIWCVTFGVACQKNFSRSHAHLLYFVRTKSKYTFNSDALRVPSARQLVYNDPRQNKSGKLPDATWMLLREQLEPYMTPDTDTWLQSRICGTYRERQKHSPNQIPVPLMERIILATSNPAELVVDPFLGTGSSGVAALRHGRRFYGCDISPTCVEASQARLAEAAALVA